MHRSIPLILIEAVAGGDGFTDGEVLVLFLQLVLGRLFEVAVVGGVGGVDLVLVLVLVVWGGGDVLDKNIDRELEDVCRSEVFLGKLNGIP